MKKVFLLAALVVINLGTAWANDYYVDAVRGRDESGRGTQANPWKTITYALGQITGTGHTVFVAAGTYDIALGETFPIIVKNGISLVGAGMNVSILDAKSTNTVLNCIGIVDAKTRITGFTIQGGRNASSTSGGGLFISAGSTLQILNNKMSGNEVTVIYVTNASPLIKDNQIINNTTSAFRISGSSSSPRVANNVIAKNSGYGVYCEESSKPKIINNTISDNTADGIYISSAQPDSIFNNIISLNSSYGIRESGSTSDPEKIRYNLFYANEDGIYQDEGFIDYYSASSLDARVPEAKNNLDCDPLFADRIKGDYHLNSCSPAIDAGDPNFPFNNEPSPNGGRINIGAYGNTGEAEKRNCNVISRTNYYVDVNSGSNITGDGSQAKPWQTITFALNQIPCSRSTLRVAAGVYKPASGEIFPIIVKNGVSLVGAGKDVCILDANNTNSVLRCISIGDTTTRIEGFTIQGGGNVSYGGGLFVSAGSALKIMNNKITGNASSFQGGGIYLVNSFPAIIKNTITNNVSPSSGGGIYVEGSSSVILDNIISGNRCPSTFSDGIGAGIYVISGSPLIKGNRITDNTRSQSALRIISFSSSPKIVNNVIARNTGAGIECLSSAKPKIINNTISDNTSDGIFISFALPDSLTNNILSLNSGYGIRENDTASDPGRVTYNLFFANGSGLYRDEGTTDYYTVSALNLGVPEAAFNREGDPLFVDRSNDNYHVRLCSPAIDAGDPRSLFNNEPSPNGGRINLGAYGNTTEATISDFSNCPQPRSDYYVDANRGSNTTGDGTQTKPWKTITFALNQNLGTVSTLHVAAGTYDTALGEIFPIIMKNGVSLVGAGIDASILDAKNTNRVLNGIGIVDASTRIEGFTIRGGGNVTIGAGIFISAGSSLTIINNKVSGNSAIDNGGGMYVINSSPAIINNTINGNNPGVADDGGGIYVLNASPLIKGNQIIGNTGYGSGLHISGASSSPRIINNVIALSVEAGIECDASARPKIINNTLYDNTLDGILISSAQPDSILNNIIAFNSNYGIRETNATSDPGKVWYNLFYANGSGLYRNEGTEDFYIVSSLNAGVPETKNNLYGDPLFMDRFNNDYHERVGSPAIDAGDPASPFNLEPSPNGGRINLGAYGNTSEAARSVPCNCPNLPDYYVDVDKGSDVTGNGSQSNPWKTITFALYQIKGAERTTIHVAAGTYSTTSGEGFPINIKDGVSLVGAGAEATILDAKNTRRVMRCVSIFDATTRIEGLTIRGGRNVSIGAGLFISAGSVLTIINNKITGNTNSVSASLNAGGGIYVANASPLIMNNVIDGNDPGSSGSGGGIYITNASPLIKNNRITGNNIRGAGLHVNGASSAPRIVFNVIAKNSQGGINCDGSARPRIINNTISDNTQDGIFISSAQPDSILNNIISFNSGYGIKESNAASDPGKAWYNLFYVNGSGVYRDEGATDYFTANELNIRVAEAKNNIDGDPFFVDRLNANYNLREISSAINAGDPNSPLDLDGTRADIGAIYFPQKPPAAPILSVPANGATVPSLTPILMWNASAGATSYRLQVAINSIFDATATAFDDSTITATSKQVGPLANNTTYFWRVKAKNGAGQGPFSSILNFKVLVTPPMRKPDIAVNPPSHNYGSVTPGSNTDKTFVVSNVGDTTLSVSATGLIGADASQFSIVSGGGTFSLMSQGSRNIVVRFAPTSVGNKSAALRISSNDPDENPFDVALTGGGNRPPLVTNAIPDTTLTLGKPAFVRNLNASPAVFNDPDGDNLTYSANSSASSIATANLSGSTLTITSVAGGVTTIIVTANDGKGGNAADTFRVTVNRSPIVANVISPITLIVGGTPFTRNLNAAPPVFTDPDNDALTYTASSSTPSIATANIAGSTLTVTPVAAGNATITVTANDNKGGTAQTTFIVTVNPDSESPKILTVDAVSIADLNTSISVSANVTDNVGVQKVWLFYREGGKAVFDSTDMSLNQSLYRATIPSAFAGTRGIEFKIQAADGAGNQASTARQSVRVRLPDKHLSKAHVGGSVENAYRLVSFPLASDNTNIASILLDDLGTGTALDTTKWRVWDINPQTAESDFPYREYPAVGPLLAGKSIFLITKENKTLTSSAGATVITTEPFNIDLKPGWNMIASPFNFDIPIQNVKPDSLRDDLFTYNGAFISFPNFLKPWEGYMIKVKAPVTLTIQPSEIPQSAFAKLAFAPDWFIRVQATCERASDVDNLIGVVQDAATEWDRHERFEPPPIGKYVMVSFPHHEWQRYPDVYTTDFRPPSSDGHVWDFAVSSNISGKPVTLRFDHLESLPPEYEIKLVDLSLKLAQDLRREAQYMSIG